jgi:putative pyruvate formate lyase activating enzyme
MDHYLESEIKALTCCTLCPQNCRANRISEAIGFCKSGSGFCISSVCAHKGEEPVISGAKGICNVFFSHCNLQCIYCQNHEISNNSMNRLKDKFEFNELIYKICETLEKTENILGFVSPSHFVPQMLAIIRGLLRAGKKPIIVYNTNSYDKPETLRMLEGVVDVYLPDFKYIDPKLAAEYSQAYDYPEVAAKALKEMYRQKGASLGINDDGIAESGIILRHLILPGSARQSVDILRFIAEEISPNLHISLMSQYYPTGLATGHPKLNRILTFEEYNEVLGAFNELGFYRGWVQDLESHAVFRPDFNKEKNIFI